MNALQLYTHCRTAAGGLLSAIDCRDLQGIEDELTRLRGFLSTREQALALQADRLYEERLDALEGVAEQLSRSVRQLQAPLRMEFQRIEETAPLLRHLTARS